VGELLYGSPPERVQIDDRTLTHVRAVCMAKLRRNEPFAINLDYDPEHGGGRITLWLSPASTLAFRFDGGRRPAVNRAWLDALMLSANSPDGLRLLEEPRGEQAAPAAEPPSMRVHRAL
jgi:hypothetical protein